MFVAFQNYPLEFFYKKLRIQISTGFFVLLHVLMGQLYGHKTDGGKKLKVKNIIFGNAFFDAFINNSLESQFLVDAKCPQDFC